MIRTILKPLSFIPALLLIYMIFSFSSQSGDVSGQLSYKVSYKIIEAGDYIFDANLDEWQKGEWAERIHFITRKLGHMAEYFALAVAVSFPLYVYGLHGILLMLVAGFICVGVACGDEYYQSTIMGRTASMKDVGIDSIGIFLGIIAVRIIGWTGRKTIFKPKVKKVKKFKHKKSKKVYYDEPQGYIPPNYNPPPQRGGYRQEPYPGEPYPQEPYQQPPYRQQPQQPPYQQPPYQNYDNQYSGNPYPPQEPYRPDQPPYGYSQQPDYEDPYVDEPEYMDDWNININDSEYQGPAPTVENDAYANDWALDSQQPGPSYYREPYPPQGPPQYQQPQQQMGPPPAAENPPKKKKKEKDWFFDM